MSVKTLHKTLNNGFSNSVDDYLQIFTQKKNYFRDDCGILCEVSSDSEQDEVPGGGGDHGEGLDRGHRQEDLRGAQPRQARGHAPHQGRVRHRQGAAGQVPRGQGRQDPGRQDGRPRRRGWNSFKVRIF